jgi:hypothetical protein
LFIVQYRGSQGEPRNFHKGHQQGYEDLQVVQFGFDQVVGGDFGAVLPVHAQLYCAEDQDEPGDDRRRHRLHETLGRPVVDPHVPNVDARGTIRHVRHHF